MTGHSSCMGQFRTATSGTFLRHKERMLTGQQEKQTPNKKLSFTVSPLGGRKRQEADENS